MGQGAVRFDFDTVVLVADLIDEVGDRPVHERRDLERTDAKTLAAIATAIGELGLKLRHYLEPADLARNADLHRGDVVWAIYGGEVSRNRMALVPAICESFGLRYVGPDTYGRVVAQDKEISKRIAVDHGLWTPRWRLLRSAADAPYVRGLALPVVVKPALEGSSIGLSRRNLVDNWDDATALAVELNRSLDQAILIEEFAPGREVAFSCIEPADRGLWAFSETAMAGDPSYFETRLYDADEKFNRKPERGIRLIDELLSPPDHIAIERFLAAFGRYGYCRVDGRLVDGRFCFLELTPDAWIAPAGQFANSLAQKGFDYAEVIARVLASAPAVPPGRPASG